MIAERFAGRLTFGTAGLRAELGAGPLRMNRLVVRQAAAGLVDHLARRPRRAGQDPPAGGRPRRPSPLRRLRRRHRRRWPPRPGSTPAGSTGPCPHRCWRSPCATSPPTPGSWSPPATTLRPTTATRCTWATAPRSCRPTTPTSPPPSRRWPPEAHRRCAGSPPPARPRRDRRRLPRRGGGALRARRRRAALSVVYTPLAVWARTVTLAAFARAGFDAPVWSPARPDRTPTSRGLPFPNPEEPGVLDAALATAGGRRPGPRPDPDADRLGVAVRQRPRRRPPGRPPCPTAGPWRLAGAVRQRDRRAAGRPPAAPQRGRRPAGGGDGGLVPAGRAPGHGGRRALRGDADRLQVDRPPGARPPRLALPVRLRGGARVLGRPAVRDKDGISAALAVRGADRRAPGRRAPRRSSGWGSWRRARPARHRPVVGPLPDRAQGRPGRGADGPGPGPPAGPRSADGALAEVRDLRDGGDLPPADVVIWDLDDGTRVVFRPSGTEPKLKIYPEVVGRRQAGARATRRPAPGGRRARCAAGGAGRPAGAAPPGTRAGAALSP